MIRDHQTYQTRINSYQELQDALNDKGYDSKVIALNNLWERLFSR